MTNKIANVSFFEGLSSKYLTKLSRIAIEQTCCKGDSVFLEGAKAVGFYVVLSGRVKIYKLSQDGKEQILHIFGPGECFGEVPVFAGGNYPAHATALEESAVLFFPRDSFVGLIKNEPALALNMLAVLSLRLRRFTHLIEDLSLKDVPGRLAAYLVYLSEKSGKASLELDVTKTQLASILGTIPETLSRILTKMCQSGILQVEGRKIRLLDRKTLEDLAAGEKMLS